MFGRGDSFDDLFNELNNMFGRNPFGRNFSKGNNKTESGKDEHGNWTKDTFTSEDGSIMITSFVRSSNINDEDLLNMFRTPQKKYSGVKGLKNELQRAIDNEDYELAIHLRDKIKQLENSQETINKLETELKEAISNQNFERAIEIREELKKLKM